MACTNRFPQTESTKIDCSISTSSDTPQINLIQIIGRPSLVLPRRYEGWMHVFVPGYYEWKVRIRHSINHSKTMQALVLLMPMTEPRLKERLSTL